MNGPCVKQRVTATIVSLSGQRFLGENDCARPQQTCPRAGMATGVGYHLCKSICWQTGHAEINALAAAGDNARGGTIYIDGHNYACDECLEACGRAGISRIVVGSPDGAKA